MNSPLASPLIRALLLLVACTMPALSDPPAPKAAEPAPAAPKVPKVIRYNPPRNGAPVLKASGGTRSKEESGLPALYLLAPEHEALTTQSQPALFWFQSAPAKYELEVTLTELTEPKKAKPLFKFNKGGGQKAGIHSVSLARVKTTLEQNVGYLWSVALFPDPKSHLKDIVASGMIKRVAVPAGLAEKIAGASQAERAEIYAEAGFWYDALQSISMAIAAEPNNPALHRLRESLLKQGRVKVEEATLAEKK